MALDISENTSRFVAAPDGVMLPIPNWVRHPETGETINIPLSARCIAVRNFAGPGYHITISCNGEMTGDTEMLARSSVHGASMGGIKILARIASLGPIAVGAVVQLVGRAISGVAATVLFPAALANEPMVTRSHNGHSITYVVFA
jgi:hypothetical protein